VVIISALLSRFIFIPLRHLDIVFFACYDLATSNTALRLCVFSVLQLCCVPFTVDRCLLWSSSVLAIFRCLAAVETAVSYPCLHKGTDETAEPDGCMLWMYELVSGWSTGLGLNGQQYCLGHLSMNSWHENPETVAVISVVLYRYKNKLMKWLVVVRLADTRSVNLVIYFFCLGM